MGSCRITVHSGAGSLILAWFWSRDIRLRYLRYGMRLLGGVTIMRVEPARLVSNDGKTILDGQFYQQLWDQTKVANFQFLVDWVWAPCRRQTCAQGKLLCWWIRRFEFVRVQEWKHKHLQDLQKRFQCILAALAAPCIAELNVQAWHAAACAYGLCCYGFIDQPVQQRKWANNVWLTACTSRITNPDVW